MPSRFNQQVDGITGITVGGTGIFPIDTEQRLLNFTLQPGGTFVVGGNPTVVAKPNRAQLAALIDLITIEVNSDTIRDFTVDELIDENAANGIVFVDGYLRIEFAESKRATVAGEESLGWPLYKTPWGVNSARVKVKFSAAAVAPTCSAEYEYDLDPQLNTKGESFANIVFWERYTIQVNGAGKKDKNDMDVDGIIQRITLRSATVIDVEAKVGKRMVWQRDRAATAVALAPYNIVQQANTYALFFDGNQVVDNGLNTNGRPLALKINHSGGGDYTALQQIRRPKFF